MYWCLLHSAVYKNVLTTSKSTYVVGNSPIRLCVLPDALKVTVLCVIMFQLLQYISDLGGVLGLWFGFAIMTFIEFFEFFIDLIILTASKLSRFCR